MIKKKKVCQFLWIHGLTLLWAVLIFVLSSISYLKPPDIGMIWQDKLGHILEFGVFGFLLQRSFNHLKSNVLRVYLVVLILGTVYAGLDEIHQSLVAGREADVADFISDIIGIALGQWLFFTLKRFHLIH